MSFELCLHSVNPVQSYYAYGEIWEHLGVFSQSIHEHD